MGLFLLPYLLYILMLPCAIFKLGNIVETSILMFLSTYSIPCGFFFWFLPWHWVVSACTCAKDLMETSADLLISYFVPLYSSSSLLSSIPPSVCWLPEPPQWKIYELYLYSLCFSLLSGENNN